jgi:hypothetical protein
MPYSTSTQGLLSETLSKWRMSMIQELLPSVSKVYCFSPSIYPRILNFGRQLGDTKFLHDLLKKVVTSR